MIILNAWKSYIMSRTLPDYYRRHIYKNDLKDLPVYMINLFVSIPCLSIASFLHVFVLNVVVVGAGVVTARFYPNIGSIIR